MTVEMTDNAKLAQAAKLKREIEEMENNKRKLLKEMKALTEGPKVVEVREIRKTDKGQVSVYVKFHRFPKTFGREELLAVLAKADELKAVAETLPTYEERKAAGLIGGNERD